MPYKFRSTVPAIPDDELLVAKRIAAAAAADKVDRFQHATTIAEMVDSVDRTEAIKKILDAADRELQAFARVARRFIKIEVALQRIRVQESAEVEKAGRAMLGLGQPIRRGSMD